MPVTMGEIVEFAADFGRFANIGAYKAAQRRSLRRVSRVFLVVGTIAAIPVANVTARIATANLNP
jgi:hypothetical protein